MRLAGLVMAVAVGAGCAGSEDELTWAEMDRDERLAYMATEVEPQMRAIFQARDPQRWADFGCPTCHGPDAAAMDYPLPEVLPALPRDGTLAAAEAIDPEMTDFMLAEVFPVMAELLDEPKYNSETAPEGFRCIGCHAEE